MLLLCIISVLFAFPTRTHALSLHAVSDLITTSAPIATSSHIVQFTATQAIPASGHIVITPQIGAFSIPASFDYTDVDFAVSSGGPFIERDLSSSANATNDGVTVVSGGASSITVTLNSTSGIAAGDVVRVTAGALATHGVNGDVNITNPSSIDSYRIAIMTTNPSGSSIDSGTAMIAIVDPVHFGSRSDAVAPVRSNGLPSAHSLPVIRRSNSP